MSHYTAEKDNEQFVELINDNKRIIYKICATWCGKQYERDDLFQEIVYNLWRAWPAYDPDFKFSTWMYRIALNVAISFYRKDSRSPIVSMQETIIELPQNAEEDFSDHFRLLHDSIGSLKELDRSLMILYLDEKTYREISEIMGISETNVATRISRCKEALRKKILKHNS